MAYRGAPTTYYGWKGVDGKFYISIKPRDENWPKMGFNKPIEALAVASGRGLPIKWEDPSVID
jgi:hypothetical protein